MQHFATIRIPRRPRVLVMDADRSIAILTTHTWLDIETGTNRCTDLRHVELSQRPQFWAERMGETGVTWKYSARLLQEEPDNYRNCAGDPMLLRTADLAFTIVGDIVWCLKDRDLVTPYKVRAGSHYGSHTLVVLTPPCILEDK